MNTNEIINLLPKSNMNKITNSITPIETSTSTSENSNNNITPIETSTSENNSINKVLEATVNITPKITEAIKEQEEKDKTITGNTITDNIQKELWEREDKIRKEIEEREDTAYQRAVEDMRKAGINPNLVGITPSASGGGITNASNVNGIFSTLLTNESNIEIQKLKEQLEKDLMEAEKSENKKDRTSTAINTFLKGIETAIGVSMMALLK